MKAERQRSERWGGVAVGGPARGAPLNPGGHLSSGANSASSGAREGGGSGDDDDDCSRFIHLGSACGAGPGGGEGAGPGGTVVGVGGHSDIQITHRKRGESKMLRPPCSSASQSSGIPPKLIITARRRSAFAGCWFLFFLFFLQYFSSHVVVFQPLLCDFMI